MGADRRPAERLRVALVAGTLGRGGAEKQLTYLVRALRAAGVDARVYALTRGEHYERALADAGAPPQWVGRSAAPAARVVRLAVALRAFRPHVVQAAHFFVNLHAALAARAVGALALAAGRGDLRQDLADTGWWGRPLLRAGHALVVNSHAAAAQAVAFGRAAAAVHVLPNVIDLAAFDRQAEEGGATADADAADAAGGDLVVAGVGSLVPAKRFDVFLAALAAARAAGAPVRGWLVGDGPERAALAARAEALGLLPHGVRFLGARADVPALLRRAGALLLTSEFEGVPNVLLEAMAAARPVVTTAAGDAPVVVADGVTGRVVPVGDAAGAAAALAALAAQPALAAAWGAAGRRRVEREHAFETLDARAAALYRDVADGARHAPARRALEGWVSRRVTPTPVVAPAGAALR